MPTYEYVCSKCEHHFDISQSIKAKALTICPKEFCPRKPWGKGHVKRAMSGGAGLIFKGSGFYITDYRSEGYKAAAKKESGETAAKKETKSSDAGGTKPAGSSPPASSSSKKD